MKKLDTFYKFMQVNGKNLSYNHELQTKFEKLSKAALRELAAQLPFTEVKVSFNKGGIAVSGDAHLMGMFENGTGLYITISEPWGGGHAKSMVFLYRTITHMKDYSGGANNYMTDSMIEEERVIDRIKQLCNI
jgi:hypothetical protein